MNLCLLVVDHDIIDPFTVVMVVKPEEIIGTSAVLRFHLAVILQIRTSINSSLSSQISPNPIVS